MKVLTRIALTILSFSLLACKGPTPELDKKLEALSADVSVAQKTLQLASNAYLAPSGKEYWFRITSDPIRDTFAKYNSLSSDAKRIEITSEGYSGHIKSFWGDCWPRDYGWTLYPSGDPALDAVLYIDRIDAPSGTGNNIQFALRDMIAGGRIWVMAEIASCFFSIETPGVGAVLAASREANAHIELSPQNGGIGYELKIDDNILMWVYVFVTPAGYSGPAAWRGSVAKGTIPDLIGPQGKITLGNGKPIPYAITFNLDSATFVEGGLAAGGRVTIDWAEPAAAR